MERRTAADVMIEFAERTGVTGEASPKRYLWTDAFAVCNFVGLWRDTGQQRYRQLAGRLVEQVHQILGRHREDDEREGPLSGLEESEASAHPTRGGLRIGKPRPERGPREAFDRRGEWDRDGQYFHYLTKWMHALDIMARATHETVYIVWARELAEVAHRGFTYQPAGSKTRPRMYWKMSIDLSRPLVGSMGHHDPLDGYVTYLQLQATAKRLSASADGPDLSDEIDTFAAMIEGREWTTTDALGLGGLLIDAYRLFQLGQYEGIDEHDLLHELAEAALAGLGRYGQAEPLDAPATRRLAFRELGLAIGLAGVERMVGATKDERGAFATEAMADEQVRALGRYVPMRDAIVAFWQEPKNRDVKSYEEHLDINEVMLASALAPDGCNDLETRGATGG